MTGWLQGSALDDYDRKYTTLQPGRDAKGVLWIKAYEYDGAGDDVCYITIFKEEDDALVFYCHYGWEQRSIMDRLDQFILSHEPGMVTKEQGQVFLDQAKMEEAL